MDELAGKIPSRVLYVAPKKSDRLQGIVDTIRLVWEESYFLQSGDYNMSNFYNGLNVVYNNLYQLEQHIRDLRTKGL